MKFSKKVLAFLLAVLMVMPLLVQTFYMVQAEEFPTDAVIYVDSGYTKAGNSVKVDLVIKNNPGILGMTLCLTYDEEKAELKSVEKGDALREMAFTAPQDLRSGCQLPWDAENIKPDQVRDGVIATLTFEVKDTAEINDRVQIGLSYNKGAIIDKDMNPLSVSVVGGDILVLNYTPGDLNDDAVVNTTDVVYLRRFIAGGYSVTITEDAGDVNDDGYHNTTDVVLIRRAIAGGYGVKLLPVTPKCAHELEKTDGKAATCEENGNAAYWQCTKCQKYYKDAAALTEIKLEETVISKLGHTEVIDQAIAPTYTSTGLTEGSHCSVCNKVIVAQEELPMLKKTEYAITYHIANNDNYLAGINIENNNPDVYTAEDGLELQDLIVDGYNFKGWYSAQTGGTRITEIVSGTTGNKVFYAQWEKIEYTVTFDSPDVPWPNTTYTVDTGVTLTNPTWFGYTFVGWSRDGQIVSSIEPGTTGNITLHANWTSNRNKATSISKLAEPIVIEDWNNARYLFVYEIGTIENVPLSVIEYIGNSQGITINKEYSYTQTISENFANTIANTISNATTKTSAWTLSEEWNDSASATNEHEEEIGKTSGRVDSQGNVVEEKYYVSNSEGGETASTSSAGGSNTTSSKVTTDKSTGLNGSYTKGSSTSSSVSLDVGHKESHTDIDSTKTGGSFSLGYTPASSTGGWGGSGTISNEKSNTDQDTTEDTVNFGVEVTANNSKSATIASSRTKSTGTEKSKSGEEHWDTSNTASSSWNTTSGYEAGVSTSTNTEVSNTISEAIFDKYAYTSTASRGGGNSSTQSTGESQELSNEYASTVEYRSDEETTVSKSITYTSDATGYYRLVNAGTVHVFAVVGYDIATNSYFTYTYNVLDEERHEYLDYSKNNANFNDCENAILPFEIPYSVHETISSVISKSNGLVVDTETGIIEEYNGEGEYVVIPEYISVNNGDGTCSAIRVHGISSNAFKGNTIIKGILFSKYIYEIPESAFEGCTSLEVVSGYGIAEIGVNAFKGCTSLQAFSVDEYITVLGNGAFDGTNEISVMAANESVATKTIASGAKRITINLSKMEGSFAERKVEIDESVQYFALIGNGSVYTNVQVDSEAKETFISNMNFEGNADTPLKINSDTVTLSRVTVKGCPGFALILPSEQTTLNLYGTIALTSLGDNAVISKDVILQKANAEVAGKLNLTGDYLLCGELSNPSMLTFAEGELVVIDEDKFNAMLTSNIITFDAAGGEVSEETKTVYYGQYYGELPVPSRTGFTFVGWFTEKTGGDQVTENTIVAVLANQTLYARWEAMAYTVSWNTGTGYSITVKRTSSPLQGAATGNLSSGDTIYYGDVLKVTYTKADYYTITSSGKTEITVTGNVTSSDIYATASLNPVSGWVKKSAAPSDAQVISRKWSYDLTTNITSSSSSVAGYTLYNTTSAWSDYGSWSGWSTTAVSGSDSRQVETRWIEPTYKTVWHYSRSVNYGEGGSNYSSYDVNYHRYPEYIALDYRLSWKGSTDGQSRYGSYGTYMADYWWNEWSETVEATAGYTEYRYRDRSLIYTYYHTKTEAKEATSNPSGQSGVSNVQEWVQYRAK